MEKYYQNYHKHTSFSHRYNKDSPLTHKDYFNYYKELADKGIPTIYSTVEHGWQSPYFRVYDDLEKFNKKNLEKNPNYKPIKFIFGTEAYWVKDRTQKDSSNCHIILLAKNDNGRKKINRAIYESFNTGYYYKNRMDLDILLSLPKDDIMCTTACVAFWNKYDLDELDEIVLKLNEHFTSFYLEVQNHNTDKQKKLNQHILDLHYKYNIPIIVGIDSHMLYLDQEADRNDLLKSNAIHYEDEDGWYMDLPSYEEAFKRFQEQGVLNDSEITEAFENTNVILNFEDIKLDRSLKVPVAKQYRGLSQEERNKIFEDIIVDEWYKQYGDINEDKYDEYIKEVKHDIAEIEACNMADYFIDSYEIMKRGQEVYGGVLTPSGRGSAVSMFLNKLLRLTKVDKINSPVLMYSERFLTKERVLDSHTPPDIDNNVSEREPFIQAQKDIVGDSGTFDLIALGTLHYKSAFKMYSRAYKLDPQIANEVSKQIAKYELALKHADEDEKDLISIYDYVDKEKYGKLIDGCQQYMGIVDTLKAHPCGCLAYSGDAIEDVGVIMVKSESQGEKAKETFVAVIESGTIDSFGYLKQDYLIVDSIGLTYDIYKEIGIEPLSVNELLKNIKTDKETWDIYANGYTMCVNQCEQKKSTEKVMKYKPQNISELTQFVAGIRPSFQSMYKTFEQRQHFEYQIKAFDTLIQDEYCDSSFILYQEHLMKVLGFAGFPMSETYTIIKAISKKKDYIIKGAKEKFIPNFAQAIIDTKETTDINKATEMAEKVWKIVEDSAAYGFNSAHAYCMAIDSVTLAWLKAHYPLEFYKVTLQRYTKKGDKDKVALLKAEMLERGFKLKPIKFGDDNRDFIIDKEQNCITQTMSSIKNMQKIAPDLLYNLGVRKKEFSELFYIFNEIDKTKLNKKSLDILIKLNYFSDYGDINYILYQLNIFKDTKEILNKFKECKQLKKTDCDKYGFNQDIIRQFADKETEKMFKVDSEKIYNYVLDNYENIIDLVSKKYIYKPTEKIEAMAYEIGLSGYTNLIDETLNDNLYIVSSLEKNQYGTVFIGLYQASTGNTYNYKVYKKVFQERPCDTGYILKCAIREQFKRVQNELGEWVESEEIETILKDYTIIKRLEENINE